MSNTTLPDPRPLVWVDPDAETIHHGHSWHAMAFGVQSFYLIEEEIDGRFRVENQSEEYYHVDTLERAQRDCEADYIERIKALF